MSPYGIEYSKDGVNAEWECGWPSSNSTFRILILCLGLLADMAQLACFFSLCSMDPDTALYRGIYFIGFLLMFTAFVADVAQMRIGSAVCKAVISTLEDGFSCDMWPFISTAIGELVVALMMYTSYQLTSGPPQPFTEDYVQQGTTPDTPGHTKSDYTEPLHQPSAGQPTQGEPILRPGMV